MKRTIQHLAFLLIACFALHQGWAEETPPEQPSAPIVVTGQLRALKLLDVSSLSVPWNRALTIERIIVDLGGFTEYASHIVITPPGGERARYRLKEFQKEEFRKRQVEPGTRLHIDWTVD